MPWNTVFFPSSMKNLLPVVRERAIEIANALLVAGTDEGMAIRVARRPMQIMIKTEPRT